MNGAVERLAKFALLLLLAALIGRALTTQPEVAALRLRHSSAMFVVTPPPPFASSSAEIAGFVDSVGASTDARVASMASIRSEQRNRGAQVRCGFLRMGGGAVPPGMRAEWDRLDCSRLVGEPQEAAAAPAADNRRQRPPDSVFTHNNMFVPPPPSNMFVPPPPPSRPAPVVKQKTRCEQLAEAYGVVPGRSWGTLPPALQTTWGQLRCDAEVQQGSITAPRGHHNKQGHHRPQGRPPPPLAPLERCPDVADAPVIAICCGTTTRTKAGWIENPASLSELALFEHLLPSVAKTVDCGFRYAVVIGYDVDDRFWDRGGDVRGRKWFDEHVQDFLKTKNIKATLHYTRVQNDIKKPGPVFTAITKHAHGPEVNADYIYRVNDDTEFTTRWASQFVRGLASLDNVGAVGPTCRQGNRKILTHDFTHKTHMAVFQAQYYPPELSDWWMDDWISRVYGPERTLRASEVEVIHHTGKHGQRYTVDKSHQLLLDKLLRSGRRKIDVAYPDRQTPTQVPPGFERFGTKGHKW